MDRTRLASGRAGGRSGSGRRFAGAVALAAAAVIVATGASATSAPKPAGTIVHGSPSARDQGLPDFDARDGSTYRAVAPPGAQAAREALSASLGEQGVLQIDPQTGTPRVVARLDGFLTGPSTRPPASVALDYVRAHLAAFGLTGDDLRTLAPPSDYVDILGTHHLTWQQRVNGVPAFDNSLRAAVTTQGQLVNVQGSPIHALQVASTTPRLGPDAAVSAALRNAGAADTSPGRTAGSKSDARRSTVYASGNRASLVLFHDGSATRLAWQVNAQASSTGDYVSVVDASTGAILWRANMVSFADQAGHGQAWEYYDSNLLAAGVGTQTSKAFPVANGTRLFGNNAHVYKDVNDDNTPVAGDEIPASSGLNWNYPVDDTWPSFNNCDPRWACTWDSFSASSWQTNIKQNATQVYYYINQFHDHLKAAPIGFTAAAGNFELADHGPGIGGDAVQGQVDDGANTAGGFPDNNHQVNANMATAQDGVPPRMQMYLFPAGGLNAGAPSGNGGDDASVIYHEYTHGLSHRLVTGPTGIPALSSFQAGAMGEAWSDWYAMDYLIDKGFDADTASVGDVQVGFFMGGGTTIPLRSEPMDCPVGGGNAGVCPGGTSTGSGGYTYGDMGHIIGQPEVHADGEIWAQTLWQLRQALGTNVTESIITRGMELSPQNPSMLDARNAILQADQVAFHGNHRGTIWSVFANRGMGFFADSLGGNDVSPTEDFHTPPACPANCVTLSGKVTDADTGAKVVGARVSVGGFTSGLPGDLTAVTKSTGRYAIHNVPKHTYGRVVAGKNGYEPVTATHVVITANKVLNFKIRRDWAATAGGAKVKSFTQPNYTQFGCGPAQAFDVSRDTGWVSDTPNNNESGHTGPRSVVLQLPKAVNVTNFSLDPAATCGVGSDAGVKAFTISTRKAATAPWVVAVKNTAALSEGRLHVFTPKAGKARVRFVKLTMKSSRGDLSFMGVTELLVHGKPA